MEKQEIDTRPEDLKLVLVVEDNQALAVLIQESLLDDPDIRVLIVEDDQKALKMGASLTPHLLMLRHRPFHRNIVEFLDALRLCEGTQQAPIIVLSDNPPFSEPERTDLTVVQMPFQAEHLLRQVQDLLA